MTEADHVANLREQAERRQFETFMSRHVAQLQSFAKPYTSKLTPEDREAFLKRALELAWTHHEQLKPRKVGRSESARVDVYEWWQKHCLQPAALSRKTWHLRTFDGRVEKVSGKALGRRWEDLL